MRATTTTLSLVGLLFNGAFNVSVAQVPLPITQSVPWHPCAKITAACTQAGFVLNGAKTGVGIEVDCIRPIMASTPQRAQATTARLYDLRINLGQRLNLSRWLTP